MISVRNRLISDTKANGNLLEYGYDLAGNRTSLTVIPSGQLGSITTFGFDNLNRLASVTDANLNITNYTYDNVGNRESVSYPNGNTTNYFYDDLNRLTRLTTTDPLLNVLVDFQYTLDPSGHRKQILESSGRVTDYLYDDLYRLTDETITDAISGNYTAHYDYDVVGNRTASLINGVSTIYSYDDNDRLTSAGGDTYGYDDNGNTISKTIDGETSTYNYDGKNHLDSAVLLKSGVTTHTSYDYDIDGIQTSKTEDSNIIDYLVDHNRVYAQVLRETDQTATQSLDYLYGDDLIQQSQNSANEKYYLYDGLGSTRALTDSTGVATDTYDYEAFGSVLNQTGTTENNYLFTGEQFDLTLDQQYLRARYYDPSIGRFTQMDLFNGKDCSPITLNKYIYGNSDSVNNIDPTGYIALISKSTATSINGILHATAKASVRVFSGITKGKKVKLSKRVGCYIGKQFVDRKRDNVEAHHPLQKSIGGLPDEQVLIETARSTHKMLHTIQNMLFREQGLPPLNKSAKFYAIFFANNPGSRRVAFQTALVAARQVDSFCKYKGKKSFEYALRREIKRWVKKSGKKLD